MPSRLRTAVLEVAAATLPVPGGGDTRARFGVLADIAARDLELARLAEAHHDAHAIAAELGCSLVPGAVYGVWAASGPDPLIASHVNGGIAISGTVPWCTGIGVVDRALVTAGDVLLDVALADGTVADDAGQPGQPSWSSPAFAETGTGAMRFDDTLPATAQIGPAGGYLERPGFWHGAICVSACWVGGAQGLLDRHLQRWRRRDPHALAHLGGASAWVSSMSAVLDRAAAEIDADPFDAAAAQRRARSVRHVIERTCTQIIDDLGVGAGPEPLAFDADILARTQQLQLYIRQCHGERDLEPLGAALLDLRS